MQLSQYDCARHRPARASEDLDFTSPDPEPYETPQAVYRRLEETHARIRALIAEPIPTTTTTTTTTTTAPTTPTPPVHVSPPFQRAMPLAHCIRELEAWALSPETARKLNSLRTQRWPGASEDEDRDVTESYKNASNGYGRTLNRAAQDVAACGARVGKPLALELKKLNRDTLAIERGQNRYRRARPVAADDTVPLSDYVDALAPKHPDGSIVLHIETMSEDRRRCRPAPRAVELLTRMVEAPTQKVAPLARQLGMTPEYARRTWRNYRAAVAARWAVPK